MKIVVSGGAGATALPASLYCLEQKDVTEFVLADLDRSRL